MTYEEFKNIMKSIYKGYDNIYIGDVGCYNNADARSKMSYYLGRGANSMCPVEYCEQLLIDMKKEKWETA
jgi:hypothetical protein